MSSRLLGSVTSLIGLQVVTRLFTFALNQMLLTLVSPEAFGTAAVQFELVSSTILFLSREGVRGAVLRSLHTKSEENEKQKARNLSLLPFLTGIPVATAIGIIYVKLASEDAKQQPGFFPALVLYVIAAVTELLSEPFHNSAMAELRTERRVRAEGLGVTSRTVITFLLLFSQTTGNSVLLAFAIGQLAYAVVVFCSYILSYGPSFLIPRQMTGFGWQSWLDTNVLRLSATLTSQSVVKHFLSEGDKFILASLTPLQDQGGYAIAANYGSLVARVLLQPIEEICRVFFARTLTPTKPDFRKGADALCSLLQVQLALSTIILVFGSAYMPIVSTLLLPRRFLETSAPKLLLAWVWYIPILALNGGLEAFLASVATPSDLNRQSRWMIVFSAIYISMALVLFSVGLGDVSILYANMVNLSSRSIYAYRYASAYFHSGSNVKFRGKDILPGWSTLAFCVVSWAFIKLNEKRIGLAEFLGQGRYGALQLPVILHIGLGGVLAIVCVGVWWWISGRHIKAGSTDKKSE